MAVNFGHSLGQFEPEQGIMQENDFNSSVFLNTKENDTERISESRHA
jgi:hypothetical protein